MKKCREVIPYYYEEHQMFCDDCGAEMEMVSEIQNESPGNKRINEVFKGDKELKMYCPHCGKVIIVDRVYPYVEVKYKPKYEESISWWTES